MHFSFRLFKFSLDQITRLDWMPTLVWSLVLVLSVLGLVWSKPGKTRPVGSDIYAYLSIGKKVVCRLYVWESGGVVCRLLKVGVEVCFLIAKINFLPLFVLFIC